MTTQNFPDDLITSTQTASKALAVTALVLGIVAVLTIFFGWPAVILGLAAIVTGVLALKRSQPKGMWLTGIITGSVGLVGGIAVLIIAAMVMAALGTAVEVMETGDLSQLEDLGVEFETE